LDLLFIREGYSVLPVHFELSALQITDIITSIVTNSLAFYFEYLLHCSIYFCIICSFYVFRVRIKIIIITSATWRHTRWKRFPDLHCCNWNWTTYVTSQFLYCQRSSSHSFCWRLLYLIEHISSRNLMMHHFTSLKWWFRHSQPADLKIGCFL